MLVERFDENGVRFLEGLHALLRHLAQDAHGEAGARERMPPEHLAGQPQLLARLAHLVLEQLAQGFDEREPHPFGQPAHVVVALDGRRRPLERDALDDVGVERPLGQELHVAQLPRLALEHADEHLADSLPLGLGVGDAAQRVQKIPARVRVHEVEPPAEGLHHLCGLVLAEQAVVHEDAGEPLAYRFLDEHRRDGGIHAAREAAHHAPVPHLAPDALDRLLDEGAHRPVARASANPAHEVVQNLLASRGVGHFGVKLYAVAPPVVGHHRRHRGALRARERPVAGRRRLYRVAVAHPDGLRAARTEKDADGLLDHHFGASELPLGVGADLPAEEVGHELHAVADAQNREVALEQRGVDRGGAVLVHAARPARQDDAPGVRTRHLAPVAGARVNLAVHVQLPHAPGDELRVLGAEIEDEYLNRASSFQDKAERTAPPPSTLRPALKAGQSAENPGAGRIGTPMIPRRSGASVLTGTGRLSTRGRRSSAGACPLRRRRASARTTLRQSVALVVGRLARDEYVVHVAFREARRRDANELRLLPQFLQAAAAGIPHARGHAAHELVDGGGKRPLVGNAALHALGHELRIAESVLLSARVAVLHVLEIAVPALAVAHRAHRPHAAVHLVASPLVEHPLAGALLHPREQAADHHAVRARRERLDDVARILDAAVRYDLDAAGLRRRRAVRHRAQLGHAHARHHARRTDGARPDAHLYHVRAPGDESLRAFGRRHVAGEHLRVRPAVLDLLHRPQHPLGVGVGAVDHQQIRPRLMERGDALAHVRGHAHRRRHAQAAEPVLGRLGDSGAPSRCP